MLPCIVPTVAARCVRLGVPGFCMAPMPADLGGVPTRGGGEVGRPKLGLCIAPPSESRLSRPFPRSSWDGVGAGATLVPFPNNTGFQLVLIRLACADVGGGLTKSSLSSSWSSTPSTAVPSGVEKGKAVLVVGDCCCERKYERMGEVEGEIMGREGEDGVLGGGELSESEIDSERRRF